jgi:O-acetyl-ADP-ribose deacetylase (regulator of RNase III)
MEITLVKGDITQQQVDAVVNAANSSLLGGGGVDGAIHRRGGPEVLAACRALRASHYGRGLPTGQAVATTAGRLPARWVIHTVGPVYAPGRPERADQLASCYREALRVAAGLGVRTLALPAISTGIYGWPMADAARIALTTVRREAGREADRGAGREAGREGREGEVLAEARFVLFDEAAYRVFEQVRVELGDLD